VVVAVAVVAAVAVVQ